MTNSIKNLSGLNPSFYLILALAYSALLAFVSLYSFKEIEVGAFEYSDKLGHLLAYFVFTLLWFLAFYKLSMQRAMPLAFLAALVFGLAMELLQDTLSETRTADSYDVVANVFGALFALIVVLLLKKRVKN